MSVDLLAIGLANFSYALIGVGTAALLASSTGAGRPGAERRSACGSASLS